MEKSAILNADLLDIVFEGRNKEYGAYDLRRTYNGRLRISIAVMLSLTLMLCIGQLIAGRLPEEETRLALVPTDRVLENVEPPEAEPPPPPPPPVPPPPQVQSLQYTEPVIVDEEVPEDEKPPEITDLEDARIDVVTQEGVKDSGFVAPPEGDKERGIIEAPKPKERDRDNPFLPVEYEAEYPNGTKAWQRFLTRNLRVPQVAIDNGIGGTVMVQFMVDKEGNVSNVSALSGPEELRAEAVRVIKTSGKWKPALQNGINVASYKRQPNTVLIQDE